MTLYARMEPTDDPEARNVVYPLSAARIATKRDVQLYYDREAVRPAGRIPWHHRRPSRRARTTILNCHCWNLVWLPDLQNHV